MPNYGQVITFVAKPEHAEEFGAALEAALPHVEAEANTSPWMAMRNESDPNVFYVVDLFATPEHRDAHLAGEAAKIVLGAAETMLAEPVDLASTTVVAVKAPASAVV